MKKSIRACYKDFLKGGLKIHTDGSYLFTYECQSKGSFRENFGYYYSDWIYCKYAIALFGLGFEIEDRYKDRINV